MIWDVGLGGGANALTVLAHAQNARCPLRLISFDRTPAPLRFALEHADALGYFGDYPDSVRALLNDGSVTFQNGMQTVRWDFCEGDFPTWLRSSKRDEFPAPHAVLYDAYSPKRNPEMWTLDVFTRLFGRLSPDRACQLPTYSRSTLLRVTLLLAGFFVGAGSRTGEKEETTIAANSLALIENPLDQQWLKRVENSTSAEPLHEPTYAQLPLTEASRDRLLAHPQFCWNLTREPAAPATRSVA